MDEEDYGYTNPYEGGLQAALARPLGWDQVFDWDDCPCSKDGLHQRGCIYYGWPQ